MGLHVATLLTGVALGTLVAYMTKDEELRKTVERFIDGCMDSFKAFLVRVTPEKTGANGAHRVEDEATPGPPPRKKARSRKKVVE